MLNRLYHLQITMRLSQVLLRKRKMNKKPDSFVRSWQWNNAWYLAQERPVYPLGLAAALEQRGIPLHQPESLLTDIHNTAPQPPVKVEFSQLGALERDSDHPLWQETPAHTYNNRTWLPKENNIRFASAITNSQTVASMPAAIMEKVERQSRQTKDINMRIENVIKDAYIGDAVQKLLPRNWRVPYIGWHPVEDKMRPRNLYDHTVASWGRSMPREYGVPNQRKLLNLSRSLFLESLKLVRPEDAGRLRASVDPESHVQFIPSPGQALVRFNLKIPLSVYGEAALEPLAAPQSGVTGVPDLSPLSPLATLHPEHIYRPQSSHPVTSLAHSHPFSRVVFTHYTTHIAPQYQHENILARGLLTAFTTVLGQARLQWGEGVTELPRPVRINIINTDGANYSLGVLQVHSLDLGADNKNTFWYQPEPCKLFDFCGYHEGAVKMEGFNVETFNWLSTLLTEGYSRH